MSHHVETPPSPPESPVSPKTTASTAPLFLSENKAADIQSLGDPEKEKLPDATEERDVESQYSEKPI